MAFHLTANLVIGINGAISDKINLDLLNVIPLVLTFVFASLLYLATRHARKKKYTAFRDVYKAIRELESQEEAKESKSSTPLTHDLLHKIIEEK